MPSPVAYRSPKADWAEASPFSALVLVSLKAFVVVSAWTTEVARSAAASSGRRRSAEFMAVSVAGGLWRRKGIAAAVGGGRLKDQENLER
jgi:hypothetical protein